jgi:hypothetical protein
MHFNSKRFDPALPLFFCTTDDDAGTSGGSKTGADDGGSDNPNNNDSGRDKGDSVDLAVQAALIDLTAKHGSVEGAAKYLIKRNHSLSQNKPTSLSKEDRDLLDKAKTIGLSGDDLIRVAGEHKTWGEERTATAKKSQLSDAVTADGYHADDADVIADLAGALNGDFSTEGEGDDRKGYVTFTDAAGKQKKQRVGEWLKEKYPKLADKLTAESSGKSQERPFKKYGGGAPLNSGQKKTLFEQIREEQKSQTESQGKAKGREKADAALQRAGIH